MPSFKSMLSYAACVAVAQAHSQLLNIQGEAGTPASVAFKVDPNLARNCTTINPCQQDATIIRDAEIKANIVNECGRTELEGNIDIGENTENALAAKAVTGVKPGTEMIVTVHQVNADGAGPYVCDLVEQGNTGIITQNLTVKNNVPGANGFSQEKFKDFNMTVVMPDKFDCTGASTGNVCTVRCRNNAQAGPFGGCFPVQQVGKKAQDFSPQSIPTASTLEAVTAQVAQDQKDLKVAEQANANAGTEEAKANAAAVASRVSVVAGDFPTQTPEVTLGGNGNAGNNNNGNNSNNNGGNNNNNNGGNNNKNGGNNGQNGGNGGNNGQRGGNPFGGNGGNGGNNGQKGGNPFAGNGAGFGGRQNKKAKREQLRALRLE